MEYCARGAEPQWFVTGRMQYKLTSCRTQLEPLVLLLSDVDSNTVVALKDAHSRCLYYVLSKENVTMPPATRLTVGA